MIIQEISLSRDLYSLNWLESARYDGSARTDLRVPVRYGESSSTAQEGTAILAVGGGVCRPAHSSLLRTRPVIGIFDLDQFLLEILRFRLAARLRG